MNENKTNLVASLVKGAIVLAGAGIGLLVSKCVHVEEVPAEGEVIEGGTFTMEDAPAEEVSES